MNYENALKAALDKGYSQGQAESYAKFMSHPSVRTALHTEERIAELEAKRQEKMEEEEAAAMILMDMVRILPVMDDDLSILADCAVQKPEEVIEKFEEEVALEDKVAVEKAFKPLPSTVKSSFLLENYEKQEHVPSLADLVDKGFSAFEVSRLITCAELDSLGNFSNASIPYLVALDLVDQALGRPNGSSLALTYRARQIVCSGGYTEYSRPLDIPAAGTHDYLSEAYTRELSVIKQHVEDIVKRARHAVETAVGMRNNHVTFTDFLDHVKRSVFEFESTRRDVLPAYFGVGMDLDPTRTPNDRGDEFRDSLIQISQGVRVGPTELKDEFGRRMNKGGAFWRGQEPIEAGKVIGYVEGRIVTECENVPRRHITGYNILLQEEHTHSWTKMIDEGPEDNVKIGEHGQVFTTRPIAVGAQFLVRVK